MMQAASRELSAGVERRIVEPLLLHACAWFLPGFGPADEARVKGRLRRARRDMVTNTQNWRES